MPAPAITACAYRERAEIYDLVRDAKITGFAIVSGDRHSFWAGYATSELPPGKFEPVGLSFVGASLSSAGAMEALEHRPPKTVSACGRCSSPTGPAAAKPDWTHNMLVKHGVRSCLEYAKSFDLERARAVSNPELSPAPRVRRYLAGTVMRRFGSPAMRCGPSSSASRGPITRSDEPDGGPIRYRVAHTAKLWAPGERPQLVQQVLEGDVGLSI